MNIKDILLHIWSDELDIRDYENAKAAYEAELEETNELRR